MRTQAEHFANGSWQLIGSKKMLDSSELYNVYQRVDGSYHHLRLGPVKRIESWQPLPIEEWS